MNCPYCNVEIDEHPAGECLNLWVAGVMGCEYTMLHDWDNDRHTLVCGCGDGRHFDFYMGRVKDYSGSHDFLDIIDYMEEKYGFEGHNGFLLMTDEEGWYCEFPKPHWTDAEDPDNKALAVCRAFVKAVGGGVD